MIVGRISIVRTPPRIFLIMYGQSNQEALSTSTMIAAAQSATGRTVVAINGSVGGSTLPDLQKSAANTNYSNMIAAAQAVIRNGDACFILWDQGEGDADAVPHPHGFSYWSGLGQLHADIVSDLGLTKATCPFLTSQKGTANVGDAAIGGGTTDQSWQTIKNAQFDATLYNPNTYLSHSDIDFVRLDGYHYNATALGNAAARFADAVAWRLGLRPASSPWFITGAVTVDATHTNINITHSRGTDFTPTSGITGFQVSGDNGATLIVPSAGVRNSATEIGLTHASLTDNSARLVRYCYGQLPPDATSLNPPSGLVLDNSPLHIPLNPTRWDVRPVPISSIPVPTFRDVNETLTSDTAQVTPTLILCPSTDNYRKFVIIGLVQGLGPTTPSSVVVTPNVGLPVTASLVAISPTSTPQGKMAFYQASLGSDANAATTCTVSVNFSAAPFSNNTVYLWTVPLADLSSTTATGTGNSSTASSTTTSAACNVSVNGFAIALAQNSTTPTNFSSVTSGYAKRWENSGPRGIATDGSNLSASASSPFSVTFADTGDCNILMAAWR